MRIFSRFRAKPEQSDRYHRFGDYRDFVPNRFRDRPAEVLISKRPGDLILTSSGVLRVLPGGGAEPR